MNWDEFIVLCPQSIAKTNLLGKIDFVGSGNKSNTARDIEGERPFVALMYDDSTAQTDFIGTDRQICLFVLRLADNNDKAKPVERRGRKGRIHRSEA